MLEAHQSGQNDATDGRREVAAEVQKNGNKYYHSGMKRRLVVLTIVGIIGCAIAVRVHTYLTTEHKPDATESRSALATRILNLAQKDAGRGRTDEAIERLESFSRYEE